MVKGNLNQLPLTMLMTLTSTHEAATDIGFLLRKNPGRPQSFSLSFGKAHVFYPEATQERCTVALLVEVDPVGLVRNRRGPSGEGGALEQYVNDRPYAASSFLSVALADVFGSALSGKSKERPELADTPLPLCVKFSALPCRGGEEFLRKLFEPLGYTVSARRLPLDEKFSDWGESSYFHVELDAGGVSGLGQPRRRALWLQRALPARRPGRFGARFADADGGVSFGGISSLKRGTSSGGLITIQP